MNAHRRTAKLKYALIVGVFLLCASTALAQTEPGCVQDGEKQNCQLKSKAHLFPKQFYKAGEVLLVEIEECGTNLALGLVTADDFATVVVSNLNDGYGRETITYVADKPGRYVVVVESREKSKEGGNYRLWWGVGDEAATEAGRQRMAAEKLLAETWVNIENGGHQAALKSIETLTKALSLWQQLHDDYWAGYTMMHLAKAYEYLERREEALAWYLKALSLQETVGDDWGKAKVLGSITQIYDNNGALKEALAYAEKTVLLMESLGDIRGEAIAINDIGMSEIRLHQYKQALSHFYHALALWRIIESDSFEATTLNNIMQAWKYLGNLPLAAAYGKLAVNKHQSLRAISNLDPEQQKLYVNNVNYSYRALADILIAQGRPKEAQQTITSFKDEQFFDFNEGQRLAPATLVLTASERAFTARYEQALKRVSDLGKQLFDSKSTEKCKPRMAATQVNELQAKWRKALEEFDLALTAAETDLKVKSLLDEKDLPITDTREMQASLHTLNALGKGQVVAVYTSVGAEAFDALVVTEKDLYGISLSIPDEAINTRAQQLWGLLQSDAYDPRILSQELYNLIFKPIQEKLPADTKTILWSLDGALRYLPMGVLYDGKQYLMQRYNHVNFTRADSERMTRAPSRHWTGLGLGNSQAHTVELPGSRHSFEATPGVIEELRAVFGSAGRTEGVLEGEVLPDEKFTKATMLTELARRRPLVHIASHFSFRAGDETQSFLLLGDGSVMTLAEMKTQRDLFAGVALLTLSACNTAAQQPDADGREIDAFAELAQRLGANAVMATLWPLSDASAPWLMGEFYRKRQEGAGLLKAEALGQAQRELLEGRVHISPSNRPRRAGPNPVQVEILKTASKRDANRTRGDIVYVDEKNAPPYKQDPGKPFAHPYYWAPVILIGNLR
jgi:CHAT domain-containing protein